MCVSVWECVRACGTVLAPPGKLCLPDKKLLTGLAQLPCGGTRVDASFVAEYLVQFAALWTRARAGAGPSRGASIASFPF